MVVADLDEAAAKRSRRTDQRACGGVRREARFEAQVDRMVERTVNELGRLDILVTCAGIIRDNLLFKMTDEDWDAVIDTHLKGTFLCCPARRSGIWSSRSQERWSFSPSTSALGNRGQANYSAAKAGLQGMARTLAIELGPYNVNVNTVAPGVHRDPL